MGKHKHLLELSYSPSTTSQTSMDHSQQQILTASFQPAWIQWEIPAYHGIYTARPHQWPRLEHGQVEPSLSPIACPTAPFYSHSSEPYLRTPPSSISTSTPVFPTYRTRSGSTKEKGKKSVVSPSRSRQTSPSRSSSTSSVSTLETELAFLRDENATISIMLDSLRNAFTSNDQDDPQVAHERPRRVGCPVNPDMDREMRTAYDDLMLQVRQLEKKVEKLELLIREAREKEAHGS